MKIDEYIIHKKFGEGKIKDIKDNKVEVYFPAHGLKVFSKDNLEKVLVKQ